MSDRQPHVLFVVGPTASGKSDLAVQLAEQAGCEIINSDSVQFFAGVNIGAAKPEPELLARARHHLIGHVPVGADYTAGDFRRDALAVIEADQSRNFVCVGGSGFYVQALEKGMYQVPEIAPSIRQALEQESAEPNGWEKLYSELEKRDSQAAEKIERNDRYRILRALEILRAHPEGTLTEIRERFQAAQPPRSFAVKKIGLFFDRDTLRGRVTRRTQQMLKVGLIDEVLALREQLRQMGLSDWAPLRSVGYNEVQNFLDGKLEKDELESTIVTSTMQLAKRQMTWFKRDSEIQWFDAEKKLDSALLDLSFLKRSN
jgi:tRNA dimethylallyltransferase